MNTDTLSQLQFINTRWTLVKQSHSDCPGAFKARQDLVERYCGAAYRYLLAITRDVHLAEDLVQEFALRLVRGDFYRANPKSGRFRDYLKTSMIHLVRDHQRKQRDYPNVSYDDHVQRLSNAADVIGLRASDNLGTEDLAMESWRSELLHRAWEAIRRDSPRLCTVLQTQVKHAEENACVKALYVSSALGESISTNYFRVALHRAREHFARLLRSEVLKTLNDATDDDLHEELKQLRLLRYFSTDNKPGKSQ